jgi:hypothetical protein
MVDSVKKARELHILVSDQLSQIGLLWLKAHARGEDNAASNAPAQNQEGDVFEVTMKTGSCAVDKEIFPALKSIRPTGSECGKKLQPLCLLEKFLPIGYYDKENSGRRSSSPAVPDRSRLQ